MPEELAKQWPFIALLVLGIGAVWTAYVIAVRDRQASDEKRIARYEDRDDRILSQQTKAIEGVATALASINDSARDWQGRVEGTWRENAAQQEQRDRDMNTRLERLERLLRRGAPAE